MQSNAEPNPFVATKSELPAWQSFLDANARWLRTVIYLRVKTVSTMEEVFQEVALAAMKQNHVLSDANQASAWLYRVAVRQSLLHLRREGRLRRRQSEWAESCRPTARELSADSPLSWLLASEQKLLIRQALDQLPEREAELLLLKYSEDWSYREMSTKLGITESAVQNRLHRARDRMRQLLAKVGIEEAMT